MNRFRISSILVISIVLLIIGLITIYSAAGKTYFIRQIIWAVIAIISCVTAYQIPKRIWENFAIYLWLFILLLLLVVLVVGTGIGSRRWFSFGFINFQPSEFAKLTMIFLLASYWANKKIRFNFHDLFLPIITTLIYTGLVFLEPDLGTALVFIPILAVMLFWKDIPVFNIFLLFSPLLSFVFGFSIYFWIPFFLILIIITYKRTTIIGWITVIVVNIIAGLSSPIIWAHLKDYQKARITGFLTPWIDPKGMNWNLIQSRIAIGSGRLFGKGFLSGTQKKLAFLPNRHNDFIFSTLAEEFGFIGSVIVLILYFYLIYQFIKIAQKARDDFSSLTAIGLATVLSYQILVNIGMVLGLLPITGIALPFLSYGGTSLLFTFITVGIILHIRNKTE